MISATYYIEIPDAPQAGEYTTRTAADGMSHLVNVFTAAADIDPQPAAAVTLTLQRPLTEPRVIARWEGTPASILAELHVAGTQL